MIRQWKAVKDAPQDISGHYEMKLGASELCHYHANCKGFVSSLIVTS
jgi:hypothetical protein